MDVKLEAQKCDHPVRPECIREPSEKSSSRVSHSSSETHSSTQQQQQQQKHSAGKNSRKRPHQQITEDRANQRNAPSASPQQQQKQHRQHHHNQQQQQQQKHQMSPQQKVESRAAATSTLDADVEALHGRRSYSLQAQARTPALFSQGLIQPGPGRDEIDFPDDFYDEFVPKQETDVPDPGNANNNKRQQVPQNRPNSLEASSYPIGFQPNQTPFRPIPRPAGLPIMTSSEEDRSPPTSTSHPSQQKQQAKFTLSDARAAMLLLNNNNQNNNSPASAFGKDSGSSSLETETMFYPVLKPGYNGPSAVVRHHKKTQGKSPGIKNQQRPNNDEGSWQQEVSSEAPVSSQGSQSIFGKGAGSGSLEDEEDSSEPGRPLTRKHNNGNNNKRMFGGARHPEYQQQGKCLI
ncbi:unnamed protein product [Notodromas monacha]|uniref:Uncharacterized protein n=1 Tax=Notodromas monacha TaxID=399045 RepID=A0A7R9BTV5_9CRUS|nr:unnamed protein product [Notodromas monacha]CAG0921327.1 unnamed protein product [Notodromas monacha]